MKKQTEVFDEEQTNTEQTHSEEKQPNTLWTRDFKIITIGSAISMLGSVLSSFAMNLMVLDYSGSTLLYSIYIALFTVPQIFMPVLSGAVLDRFSRKKTIYTLDFISAGLYLVSGLILMTGYFSYPLFAVMSFLIGAIEGVYITAYQSFYPLLITEGNYQKAYSIDSILETLSGVMIPLSALLYRFIGLAPLMLIDAVSYFLAAVMETRIEKDEEYIEAQRATRQDVRYGRQMLLDLREGFLYLFSEKGLLFVGIYFFFSAICQGVDSVIVLPYFKGTFDNGEFVYMIVWGMAMVGRVLGGSAHYRWVVPKEKRYKIALTVYIVISVAEAVYLFFPIPLMMLLCFITGVGGVTSYTIRISATQSYVPDEKKGRFNGAFNMLNTVGMLLGEFLAGVLSLYLSERLIVCAVMLSCAAAAVVFIGGGGRHVAKVYNRVE